MYKPHRIDDIFIVDEVKTVTDLNWTDFATATADTIVSNIYSMLPDAASLGDYGGRTFYENATRALTANESANVGIAINGDHADHNRMFSCTMNLILDTNTADYLVYPYIAKMNSATIVKGDDTPSNLSTKWAILPFSSPNSNKSLVTCRATGVIGNFAGLVSDDNPLIFGWRVLSRTNMNIEMYMASISAMTYKNPIEIFEPGL